MNYLIELREEDIFPDTPTYEVDDTWKDRIAVKALVFDDEDKIALFGPHHQLLPGGGVEEGETLEEAIKRECIEEIGCNIEVQEEIGVSNEFRHKIKSRQETHCFLAKVVGEKGEPQSLQEDEQDATTQWKSVEEALALHKGNLNTFPLSQYHWQFNVRAHIAFIEKYIRDKS